jgi:hypothetical protein
MADRQRIYIRPRENYYDMTEEQQLEWIRALRAEVLASMDAMDD